MDANLAEAIAGAGEGARLGAACALQRRAPHRPGWPRGRRMRRIERGAGTTHGADGAPIPVASQGRIAPPTFGVSPSGTPRANMRRHRPPLRTGRGRSMYAPQACQVTGPRARQPDGVGVLRAAARDRPAQAHDRVGRRSARARSRPHCREGHACARQRAFVHAAPPRISRACAQLRTRGRAGEGLLQRSPSRARPSPSRSPKASVPPAAAEPCPRPRACSWNAGSAPTSPPCASMPTTRTTRMRAQLNAQAFTIGNHIHFRHGKFDPDHHAGRLLLAHELVHTLQQGRRRPRVQRKTEAEWKYRGDRVRDPDPGRPRIQGAGRGVQGPRGLDHRPGQDQAVRGCQGPAPLLPLLAVEGDRDALRRHLDGLGLRRSPDVAKQNRAFDKAKQHES